MFSLHQQADAMSEKKMPLIVFSPWGRPRASHWEEPGPRSLRASSKYQSASPPQVFGVNGPLCKTDVQSDLFFDVSHMLEW